MEHMSTDASRLVPLSVCVDQAECFTECVDQAESFTDRGIDASLGRHGAPSRIEAHKWFNIAALTGAGEAIRLRRELAQEMTADEIATAQRLAREWLKDHPVARPDIAA